MRPLPVFIPVGTRLGSFPIYIVYALELFPFLVLENSTSELLGGS